MYSLKNVKSLRMNFLVLTSEMSRPFVIPFTSPVSCSDPENKDLPGPLGSSGPSEPSEPVLRPREDSVSQ